MFSFSYKQPCDDTRAKQMSGYASHVKMSPSQSYRLRFTMIYKARGTKRS